MSARVQFVVNRVTTSTSSITFTPTAPFTNGNNVLFEVEYASTGGSAIALAASAAVVDQGGNALNYQEGPAGVFNSGQEFGHHVLRVYNLQPTSPETAVTAITIKLVSAANLGMSGVGDEWSGLDATSGGLLASSGTNTMATTAANNIGTGTQTPSSQPCILWAKASDDSRSNHSPTAGTSPIAFTAGPNWSHPVSGTNCGLVETARITSTATAVGGTFTNIGPSGDVCPAAMMLIAEAASVPTITGVTGGAYQGSLVITGTNFTATMTGTMGGVNQTVTYNSATQCTISSLARSDGTNQCGYGTQNLVLTSSVNGSTAPFAMAFTPQSGGQYVNLTTPVAPVGDRPAALPDYPGGNGEQLAIYGLTGSGAVTLNTDGSFVWDSTVTGFYAEFWSGTQWTAAAFQTLQVQPAGVTPPSIVTQPTAQTVNAGQTATFTATGAGGGTLAWQAYRNGVIIAGAAGTGTGASYTTPATNYASDNGAQFDFVFTNSAGSATTNTVSLTVLPLPVVTAQPIPQTVNEGQAATFTAQVSVSSTWQAYRNGIVVAGATGTGLTASYTTPVTIFAVNNGDLYSFTFTAPGGTVSTNAASLAVIPMAAPSAPIIKIQPGSQVVIQGAAATFNLQATGAGPLTYQWFKNGVAIAGATNPGYITPPSVYPNDSGAQFTCTVANAQGSVTSNIALLTVNLAQQIIVIQPPVPPGLIGICNLALSLLGEQAIVNLTDNTNRARVLNLEYAMVRDAELRKHRWKFSILRTNLAPTTTVPASGLYTLQYPLPPDCLRVLDVGIWWNPSADLSDYRSMPRDDDYSLEGNRTILTNLPSPLALRYVSQITDTNQYDSAFTMAFAAQLAWKCCERITSSVTKRNACMNEYKMAIADAIRANALETVPATPADDTWVMSRLL